MDEAAAAEVTRGTRLRYTADVEGMLERIDQPVVDILLHSIFALAAERVEPDRITDALVNNVAANQHADGWWGGFGIQRPPVGRLTDVIVAVLPL